MDLFSSQKKLQHSSAKKDNSTIYSIFPNNKNQWKLVPKICFFLNYFSETLRYRINVYSTYFIYINVNKRVSQLA
jgi:hypothetical protein